MTARKDIETFISHPHHARLDASAEDSRSKPITYAVRASIDTRNALFLDQAAREGDQPARSDVDLGGFGGLFDLKRAGLRSWRRTTAIGTKAQDHPMGSQAVKLEQSSLSTLYFAMCVNTRYLASCRVQETAEIDIGSGPARRLRERLDRRNQRVPGVDIDARTGVGDRLRSAIFGGKHEASRDEDVR